MTLTRAASGLPLVMAAPGLILAMIALGLPLMGVVPDPALVRMAPITCYGTAQPTTVHMHGTLSAVAQHFVPK